MGGLKSSKVLNLNYYYDKKLMRISVVMGWLNRFWRVTVEKSACMYEKGGEVTNKTNYITLKDDICERNQSGYKYETQQLIHLVMA